jgi:ADP-heptose:LPS heptosyltransferase
VSFPTAPRLPTSAFGAASMTARFWVCGLKLRSSDFPLGTPLNHFFAWNEKRWRHDCRYVVARDLYCLITALGNNDLAQQAAVAHLSLRPVIIARRGRHLLVRNAALPREPAGLDPSLAAPTSPPSRAGPWSGDIDRSAVGVARRTVERLAASLGSADTVAHAEFFAAIDQLADKVDLFALARRRPQLAPSQRRPPPRRILVIRLSALGDFIQALGPAAAIRRSHRDDHITLLTTSALAGFAARLGVFDRIMIDPRPRPFDIAGWLALRRRLRHGGFDRVYDLQTSERSAVYARLFGPGPGPEWSGVAVRCSHPHANLDRDRQHTIDKQAEQLLMAGIYPTPLPSLPPLDCALPPSLGSRPFVLLVPGSSPRHPAKRWPAERYGMLAMALRRAGYGAVVIGSRAEQPLAAAICAACPGAVDLVGCTDLAAVAALAQRAALAVGNDTGVTHLAAAAGCPVIALFSSASDPNWCGPRGHKVRVLAVGNLADLGVDPVFTAALQMIGCAPATLEDGPGRAAGEPVASGAG